MATRTELHTFAVIPKRWSVERSCAGLEKCRRLWNNCERKLETSLNMAVFAFFVLLLKNYERALSVAGKNLLIVLMQ